MTIFLVTFSILLLLTVFRIVLPFFILHGIADRHVDFREIYAPSDFGLEARHCFVTTDDDLKISVYEVETAHPKAVIICLSGMHHPSATAYLGHASLFRKLGYATLFFDMRAHGESQGNKICMGYREHLDVKALVKYVRTRDMYRELPIVLLGMSLGASTSIIAAGMMPEVKGLISISAFSSWEDIFADKMTAYAPAIFARLEKPFVLLSARIKYRVDSKSVSPVVAIKNLDARPVLLMHSRNDSEVPFANFERLMKHAPKNVETFVREGDMHSIIRGKFTEPENDPEYLSVITSFLEKHFPGSNQPLQAETPLK